MIHAVSKRACSAVHQGTQHVLKNFMRVDQHYRPLDEHGTPSATQAEQFNADGKGLVRTGGAIGGKVWP